jgi:hypothetical protein
MPKKISQLAASTTLADTDLFEKANPGVASNKFSGASLRSTLLNPATIGGTAGIVPMFAAASPFLANSPLVVAAGLVGIGTLAAATSFHVATSLTTSPRGIMSSQHNDGTDGARVHLRKSRGTNVAPTTVVSGDNLGRIVATGYDGTNYLEMGTILIGTEGTIAATRIPTNLSFWTATDAAPSVLTQRMTILSNGNVGIGTASPDSQLNVHRATNGYAFTCDRTAGAELGVFLNTVSGQLGTKNNFPLSFFTNDGNPQLTLLVNGNFGVGTESPDTRFAVRGGDFSIGGYNGGTNYGAILTPSDAGVWIWMANIGGIGFQIGKDNVIGVTPLVTLSVTGNLGLGTSSFGTSAVKVLALGSGTAPSTSPVDEFQMYSADIAAGHAAAHFRTELGTIIKLYQQALIANPSGGATQDAESRTAITSILTLLKNNGLMASV